MTIAEHIASLIAAADAIGVETAIGILLARARENQPRERHSGQRPDKPYHKGTTDLIRAALRNGRMTIAQIIEETGRPAYEVRGSIAGLCRSGGIV